MPNSADAVESLLRPPNPHRNNNRSGQQFVISEADVHERDKRFDDR